MIDFFNAVVDKCKLESEVRIKLLSTQHFLKFSDY